MIQWCESCQEHFCESCDGPAQHCADCENMFHEECYEDHLKEILEGD